jgi:nitrogen-specific signal transduction histidine kinase
MVAPMTPRYRVPDPESAVAAELRNALEAARCAAQLLVWTATDAEHRMLAEAAVGVLDRAAANLLSARVRTN